MTPWTVARQAPVSMGFSRQEYWSGWPCSAPGDLPTPGIKPTSAAPALQTHPLPLSHWEAQRQARLPKEVSGNQCRGACCFSFTLDSTTFYRCHPCHQNSRISLAFHRNVRWINRLTEALIPKPLDGWTTVSWIVMAKIEGVNLCAPAVMLVFTGLQTLC